MTGPWKFYRFGFYEGCVENSGEKKIFCLLSDLLEVYHRFGPLF